MTKTKTDRTDMPVGEQVDHAWTMDAIRRQERHVKEKNRRQKRRR